MPARQQGRELQLEIGIVPLIREQGCERVVWRVKHLSNSEQEPIWKDIWKEDGAVLLHSNRLDLRSLDDSCGLMHADIQLYYWCKW